MEIFLVTNFNILQSNRIHILNEKNIKKTLRKNFKIILCIKINSWIYIEIFNTGNDLLSCTKCWILSVNNQSLLFNFSYLIKYFNWEINCVYKKKAISCLFYKTITNHQLLYIPWYILAHIIMKIKVEQRPTNHIDCGLTIFLNSG